MAQQNIDGVRCSHCKKPGSRYFKAVSRRHRFFLSFFSRCSHCFACVRTFADVCACLCMRKSGSVFILFIFWMARARFSFNVVSKWTFLASLCHESCLTFDGAILIRLLWWWWVLAGQRQRHTHTLSDDWWPWLKFRSIKTIYVFIWINKSTGTHVRRILMVFKWQLRLT